MDHFHLSSMPKPLREEIYKKMDIISFTRMRRACREIHDHISEDRKRMNVYFELKKVTIEKTKTKIITANGQTRGTKSHFDPIEFTGAYIERFLVEFDGSQLPWIKEFSDTFMSRPLHCVTFDVFGRCPQPQIESLLQCFTNVRKIHITVCREYTSNILTYPVVQGLTKDLTVDRTLLDFRMDLVPSNCKYIYLDVPDTLDIDQLYHFLKSLQTGARRLNKLDLWLSFNKEIIVNVENYKNNVVNNLGLELVWSEKIHGSSCFKDLTVDRVRSRTRMDIMHKLAFEEKFYYIGFGFGCGSRKLTIRVFSNDEELVECVLDEGDF